MIIENKMDQNQVREQHQSGGKEAEGTSWVFDPSFAWVVTSLPWVLTSLFTCNLVQMM